VGVMVRRGSWLGKGVMTMMIWQMHCLALGSVDRGGDLFARFWYSILLGILGNDVMAFRCAALA